MKKTKKSTIFRFTYIGATVLVLVLIAVFNEDFHNIPEVLSSLNLYWLLGAIACLVGYWLTDGWLLGDITSYMSKQKLSAGASVKIGLIGLYYCALTPSSTGGQPVQVMYMGREKLPVGTSTCIVLVKFIAYALTTIAFYLISLAYDNSFYFEKYPAIYWLALLGFAIMVLAIVLVILSIVKKNWILNIAYKLINFFSTKIRIIKNTDEARANIEKTINDYSEAGRYIAKHKRRAIGSFFISMLNIGLYFAITYFIYRAFNLDEESFIYIMMMQAFLYTAISYFPLPGAAGMSESGFFVVFSAIFSPNLVFAAMIVWRIFTYYAILAVGSIIVIFDELFIMKKQKLAQPATEENQIPDKTE